jgi:predicted nucleic acid-binding protein
VRVFVDSNVVVYAYDPGAGAKQLRAHRLMEAHALDGTLALSVQVLQESYVNLVRKKHLTPENALRVVDALAANHVVTSDASSVLRGLTLSQRFRLSPWDGLIVQAALDGGCTTLFTEDLQAAQRFGDLEVVNPFADAAHEPRRTYVATAKRARRATLR